MGGRKTAGKILREAFWLYRRHFRILFITVLILFGITFVYGLLYNSALRTLHIDNASMTNYSKSITSSWSFIPTMIATALSVTFSRLLSIPSNMLDVNAMDVAVSLTVGKRPRFLRVTGSFKRNWLRYLGVSAWSALLTSLWSFLFLVPGLIKQYSYMLAPYLVLQYPDMGIRQALKKSMEMTKGYKGRLFLIQMILFAPYFLIYIILGFALHVRGDASVSVEQQAFNFIANVTLLQPLLQMANAVAYLDIERAAIEKGILPGGGPYEVGAPRQDGQVSGQV